MEALQTALKELERQLLKSRECVGNAHPESVATVTHRKLMNKCATAILALKDVLTASERVQAMKLKD